MKQLRLLFLFLVLLSGLTSCSKTIERARQNIAFEGIQGIKPHGLSGVDVMLGVRNNTAHKLVLKEAQFDLCYDQHPVATILLRERAEVPRRFRGTIPTSWHLRIDDPLAFFALSRKLQKGEEHKITVSYNIRGRGGLMPIKISGENASVSKLLNIFGVSLQEVKKLKL